MRSFSVAPVTHFVTGDTSVKFSWEVFHMIVASRKSLTTAACAASGGGGVTNTSVNWPVRTLVSDELVACGGMALADGAAVPLAATPAGAGGSETAPDDDALAEVGPERAAGTPDEQADRAARAGSKSRSGTRRQVIRSLIPWC